jgi:hypothetical protein
VTWEEVEQQLKKKDPSFLVFEAEQVIQRVEKLGDLFEATLKLKQTLPKFPGLEKGVSAKDVGLEISAQAATRTGSGKKSVKAASPESAKKRTTKKTAAKTKARKT